MKNIWQIILAITVAGTFGAGVYIALGIKRLLQISYYLEGYKFEGFDVRYIYLKLFLLVKNKSDVAVNIKRYFINVLLNDKLVAILSSKKNKTIEAEKSSKLELPIKIDYNNVFGKLKSKEIMGYFVNKEYDKIIFSLKGKFSGSILKIPIFAPLKIQMSLKDIIVSMDNPQE